MAEVALTSFTACDAYRYFADQASLLTSQSRSRTKYWMPADGVIVFDRYINLTKKCNLIGRL